MVGKNGTRIIARETTLEEKYEALITEGQFVPGDHGSFEDGREIPWLDMDLAQSGQEFFQKYYAAITFSHGLYFGLGFGFKPITSTIIRTRGFHGIEQTSKRLLSTLWHVLRWYECDIIGCYADGYKAIARVRKTHTTLRRRYKLAMERGNDLFMEENEGEPDDIQLALKKDLAFLDLSVFKRMDLTYNTPEPMSQLSLAITQLGFLFPIFAHPEAFGIDDLEGAEGFEHLWAVIGYLSGLEDRFNFPLHRPGKDAYIKAWKEIFIPSFLERDSKIVEIQNNFYLGTNTSKYMPALGPAAGMYFFLKQSDALKEFGGSELYKVIPMKEKLSLILLRFIFWLMTVSIFFRNCANSLTRKMIDGVLDRYNKEQLAAGRELTTLPKTVQWSRKYRRASEPVVRRWKLAQTILDLMSSKKIRMEKRKMERQKNQKA